MQRGDDRRFVVGVEFDKPALVRPRFGGHRTIVAIGREFGY
jgi:hypothetical protein